jgi:DNA-binding transcriptional LysR family regulator
VLEHPRPQRAGLSAVEPSRRNPAERLPGGASSQWFDDLIQLQRDRHPPSLLLERTLRAAALAVTPLFDDELMLVVGRAHPLAGRDQVRADVIRGERFILFERGASIRRATDRLFHEIGATPDLALESNDTYFIKLMVERGMGISVLPAWAVRDEVAWGRLARLRIRGHRLRRSVALLSAGRFVSAATRAFLDFVKARREDLQRAARGGWR